MTGSENQDAVPKTDGMKNLVEMTKKLLSVPKEELDRREAEERLRKSSS